MIDFAGEMRNIIDMGTNHGNFLQASGVVGGGMDDGLGGGG
jgi:hypothetical protein